MNRIVKRIMIIMLLIVMAVPVAGIMDVMAAEEQDIGAAEEAPETELLQETAEGPDEEKQETAGEQQKTDEETEHPAGNTSDDEESVVKEEKAESRENTESKESKESKENTAAGDKEVAGVQKKAAAMSGKAEVKGIDAPLVQQARAMTAAGNSDEPLSLNEITWKITGTKKLGAIGYNIRKVTHINGVDVDESSDLKTSYAYCVEPLIVNPEGLDAQVGDSYTAKDGKHGVKIYTFDGSNDGDFAMMRKMCYYLAGGYGWNSRTKKWYSEYKKKVDSNEFNEYTLSATILSKRWGKDASDAEGNANYSYNRLSDEGKALVDKFLKEVPKLPDPPESYIAFYVLKENCQDIWGSLYAEPESGFVSLKKKSTIPALTDALSSIYSLAGATYYVYKNAGCTERAEDLYGDEIELKTDASGNTGTIGLRTGDYWVKEVTAPYGYDIDTKAYPVTVKSKETSVAVSSEQPAYDIFNVMLEKQSEEYGYKRLIGAEYTLKYYETDPERKDVSEIKPKKTWVFRVKEGEDPASHRKSAIIDFLNDEPISGGSMYKVGGKTVMPLGVFTLKETKAPRGLAVDPVTYMGKVARPSAGAAAKASINGSDNLYVKFSGKFELLNMEMEKSIRLTLQKKDADTGEPVPQGQESDERKADFGSLEGAVYEVYINDPTVSEDPKVGEMVTDQDGRASIDTDSRTGRSLMPGTYYIKEVKASQGYVRDAYAEKEVRKQYEDGVHIVNARVDDISDKAVFEYTVDSMEAPHHAVIHKTDITTGSELPGATLQVIDSEGTVVEEWISKEKPHDIAALPDGKYTLREITAPYGYEMAEDVEFEVKEDIITCEVTMKDKPEEKGGIVRTVAVGKDTESHLVHADESVTVTDSVMYEKVVPGEKYIVEGELYDKTTGKMTGIRSSAEFVPDSPDGIVNVEFTFNGTEMQGHSLVVFEKMSTINPVDNKTVIVDEHNNPDDEDQTVFLPEISTEIGKRDGDKVTDVVRYRNLIPGRTYVIKGYFVKKKDGTIVEKSDGKTVITPDEPDGEAEVKLKPGNARGELVAFESIYLVVSDEDRDSGVKEILIGEHKDIESEAQTYTVKEGPKTGDSGELTAYLILLIIAGTAFIAAAVNKKRGQSPHR